MTHFPDDSGNIPGEMPKEARELASFLALVVDTTTKNSHFTLTLTDITCFEKGCDGMIKSELLNRNNEIHWMCSKCHNEGRISHWKGTKWDNTFNKK